MLPGWTGLAQIWLLKYGILDKSTQIRLDNIYVDKRSLQYNLKITCATLFYMLKKKKMNMARNASRDRIKFKKKLEANYNP